MFYSAYQIFCFLFSFVISCKNQMIDDITTSNISTLRISFVILFIVFLSFSIINTYTKDIDLIHNGKFKPGNLILQ